MATGYIKAKNGEEIEIVDAKARALIGDNICIRQIGNIGSEKTKLVITITKAITTENQFLFFGTGGGNTSRFAIIMRQANGAITYQSLGQTSITATKIDTYSFSIEIGSWGMGTVIGRGCEFTLASA